MLIEIYDDRGTIEVYETGIITVPGAAGQSAFEFWLSQPGNEGKTEEDFLNFLGSGNVDSVNGKAGVVILDPLDIGLGLVNNVPDILKPVSKDQRNYALRAAQNLKGILSGAYANRYMFGVTRNSFLYGSMRTAPSDTNYVGTLLKFGLPEFKTNDYRFHFSGFAMGGSTPTEVNPGNDQIIYGVWFSQDLKTWVRATFGGLNSYTIANGSEGVWNDPVIFPRDSRGDGDIYCYTIMGTPAGSFQLTSYRVEPQRGERVWGADNGAALEAFLATPTVESDSRLYTEWSQSTTVQWGQSQNTFYGPDAVVMKGWDGRPVTIWPCDSIGESRQEFAPSADERGNKGYVRRFLDEPDPIYGRIPHFMVGAPGGNSARELQAASIKRWNVIDSVRAFNNGLDAWTTIGNQNGNNDIGNPPYSSVNYRGLVTRLRARYPGVKIVGIPPLVNSTATNGYIDAAGQTVSANNALPDGTRWALVADICSGNTLFNDDFIENRGIVSDPVYPDRWITGLFDIHLTQAVGTDGVETYAYLNVDKDGVLPGEIFFSYDAPGISFTIREVNGRVLKIQLPRSTVLPAGTLLKSASSVDGIHPTTRMINYLYKKMDQSQKLKLLSSACYPRADGIFIKGGGTNPRVGKATLINGTVTINTTAINANSKVYLTVSTPGGTRGFLSYGYVANTSLTINSTSNTETSVVDWVIVEELA